MDLGLEELTWHEAGHIIIAESFGIHNFEVKRLNNGAAVKINLIGLNNFEAACITMGGYIAAKEYSDIDAVICMMHSKSDYDKAEKLVEQYDLNRQEILAYIYNVFDANYDKLQRMKTKLENILKVL